MDRTRRAIVGSRLCTWRCESHAPEVPSDFRLSDDPPSCRMFSALTNTVFSKISGFESAWFSKCLPVLSGPSDLPDCHPARWMRGWLSAHGDVDSLLGPAASLEAFQPSELPVCMQAWTVTLPLLRDPPSCRTVFELSDVDCLSNLSPPEILVTCLYLIRVFEDLHIQKCSSAPAPESPVDPASCRTVPLIHRLGLWLGGCGVPALLKVRSCPISILMHVCRPKCLLVWTGPEDLLVCKLVSWKRGLLATRVGEASHRGQLPPLRSRLNIRMFLGQLYRKHTRQYSRFLMTKPLTSLSRFHLLLTPVLCPLRRRLPGPLLPFFVVQPPQDSAQSPNSKRHASSTG